MVIVMRFFQILLLPVLWSGLAWGSNRTEIKAGCAPWDGPTLEIRLFVPDAEYRLTIWGAGYQALQRGATTLSLDEDEGNMAGHGEAVVCGLAVTNESRCHHKKLTVQFDQAELRDRGAVAGMVLFDGLRLPFSGQLADGQRCG